MSQQVEPIAVPQWSDGEVFDYFDRARHLYRSANGTHSTKYGAYRA